MIGGTTVTLTALAIAAIAGILLNMILPGNDYEFGVNESGDENRRNPRIKKNAKEKSVFSASVFCTKECAETGRGKSGFSLHFGTGKCVLEGKKI